MVGAIEELGNVNLPVVVRLEGTNVEEGRRILSEAPPPTSRKLAGSPP